MVTLGIGLFWWGKKAQRLLSGRATSSTAPALRWRAVGRCASQHDTEQNTYFTRPELQVDTEQR